MIVINNICGYLLDEEQQNVINTRSKYVLVSAGAGSGKTLTIMGKIKYLIENNICKEKDILVISFTNNTVNNLKEKLYTNFNYKIDVLTFHKLGLKILENTNTSFTLSSSNYLDYVIDEYFNGVILENELWCRKILKYMHIKYKNIDSYKDFISSNNYDYLQLKTNISRFISLFKTNNYNIDSFYNMLYKSRKNIFKRKDTFLLRLILDVYLYYESELKSSFKIDLDDVIINAIKKIDNITFNYKYVIIDEYQDTSKVKFDFIRKLIDKMDANLLVVGDDFQSIYRFTGCDLDLFFDFNKYFYNAEVLRITNTYRTSYELINVAGNFVMKNKKQMTKLLKSNKHIDKPINIYYKNDSCILKRILDQLSGNVMILSRNNNDIYKYLDNELFYQDNKLIYKNNNKLNIEYYTVHKSKGLESDNVIILNMINSKYGFPSLRSENRILKYVNNYKSSYYLDEERRLFYVALTRSKNKVYILTNKLNPSIFVKEIVLNSKKYINIIK